jgi:hypothetical protein
MEKQFYFSALRATTIVKIILIGICSFLNWSQAIAATYSCNGTVSSCQSSVSAASDGDTVSIPAGDFSWTSGLSWTNKNITLQGAGIGVTNITNNTGGSVVSVFADTKPFRITGMTINTPSDASGWISVTQSCATSTSCSPILTRGWRIDHIRFNFTGSGSAYAILADGYFTGLVDNCYFYNNGGSGATMIGMRHLAKHGQNDLNGITRQWGDNAWKRPTGMGTDDAIFMEDNIVHKASDSIYYLTIVDGSAGSRLVIRYNTFINQAGIQVHATGNPGRGAVFTEVYHNTFSTYENVGVIRSGTGVIYDNITTGGTTPSFLIDDQRSCGAIGPYPVCNGSYNYDGNTSGESGWPCLDQIGRGSSTSAGSRGNYNISEPLYFWNNGGMVFGLNSLCAGSNAHIKRVEDSPPHTGGVVDYVVGTPKPGYTAYMYPHPLRGSIGIGIPASPGSLTVN